MFFTKPGKKIIKFTHKIESRFSDFKLGKKVEAGIKMHWLVVLLFFAGLAVGFYLYGLKIQTNIVMADVASPNVSGFAWSENFGWVSFNAKDCDPDSNGIFNGTPVGCPLSSPPPVYSYGVNIDPITGVFSGHAWSAYVGWIDFGPTSGFPEAPFTAATYDPLSGNVTGWAKVLSLGDDGWLKMSDDKNTNWNGRGVKITKPGSTYEFSGWAWNANTINNLKCSNNIQIDCVQDSDCGGGGARCLNYTTGIGWLSFNSTDAGAGGGPYKVGTTGISAAPTVALASMLAPQWSSSTAEVSGALLAKLTFTYSDSEGLGGSAYRIVITDKSTGLPTLDTGKCSNGSTSPSCYDFTNCLTNNPFSCTYIVDNNRLGFSAIDYGINYFWSVQVWNPSGVASALTQYNNNSGVDTDHNSDTDSRTFSTYTHEFPDAKFTFSPAKIYAEQLVSFDATQSTTTAPFAPLTYSWTFTNGTPGTATTMKPSTRYGSNGSSLVTLVVTDKAGYQSSTSTNITISNKLPSWQEVKPN